MRAAPAPLAIGGRLLPQRVLAAPMTGVSDLPFRQTLAACGAVYAATEMVASEAFAAERPEAVRRAAVGEGLPLTVIQLLGRDPAAIGRAAALAAEAGADLIDLNMGCPAKEVTGAACGAALMRDLDLAERLVAAAAAGGRRPVTVKMRLGWAEGERTCVELARRAEAAGAAAVTVHGRSRMAFYSGEADWRAVAAVRAEVRIPVIVNGDVRDADDARRALAESGADAVMLGRGLVGRPWIVSALHQALEAGASPREPGPQARLEIVLAHLGRALRFHGDGLGLRVFCKHLARYVEEASFSGGAEARRAARAELCRLESGAEVERRLSRLWREAAAA